jgi:hypothetical protein
VKNKTKEWHAYLAGFIDGEGSICIAKRDSKTGNSSNFYVVVDITNTNYDILYKIQTEFGGSLRKPKARSSLHKPIYHLRLVCQKAEVLLLAINPYTQVKKQQLELALELRKTNHALHWKSRSGIKRGERLDPAIIKTRQILYKQAKILNKRGKNELLCG